MPFLSITLAAHPPIGRAVDARLNGRPVLVTMFNKDVLRIEPKRDAKAAKLANQGGVVCRVVSATSENGGITLCAFTAQKPQSFTAFR